MNTNPTPLLAGELVTAPGFPTMKVAGVVFGMAWVVWGSGPVESAMLPVTSLRRV